MASKRLYLIMNNVINITIITYVLYHIRMEISMTYNIMAVSLGFILVFCGIYYHCKKLEEADIDESDLLYADIVTSK